MNRSGNKRYARGVYLAGIVAICLVFAARAEDEPLVLLVQPLPAEEHDVRDYWPLAAYLETAAGRRVTVEMPPVFPAYWEAVRAARYDLALDAPHFTDYRIQKLGFTLLAKTPETTSYSLVMRRRDRVADPSRLAGKRVASLGLLALGTLRLNALFPAAQRQPVLVDGGSTAQSLRWLRSRRVAAAFLPTVGLGEHLAPDLALVLTTEPIPRLGFSASSRLPPRLRDRLGDALLYAHETEAGRAMLRAIGFARFDAAAAGEFAKQSYVLRGYWGY